MHCFGALWRAPYLLNRKQKFEQRKSQIQLFLVCYRRRSVHGTRLRRHPGGIYQKLLLLESLDYGTALEARIEMELDTGEKHILTWGDVAVQRATMHTLRNMSDTEWARMVFVLQDCQPLKLAGQ